MSDLKLVKVSDAVEPLGFDNEQQLYRVIREKKFPYPQAVARFGKGIRINLAAVKAAMDVQAFHVPTENIKK